MKKSFLSLVVLLCLTCLTGCDSNSDVVDVMLNTLKNNDVVDKKLVLVDKVTKTSTTLFFTKTTYYIYENQDSKLIAINYDTNKLSTNDYDYSVKIYNDVLENDVEYIDDSSKLETYHTYQDGRISKSNKYSFSNGKVYQVYEKKNLFSKIKYELIEVK